MKQLVSGALGAVLSVLIVAGEAHAGFVVDQECTSTGSGGISARIFSLAQSFTPTKTSVDKIELYLANSDTVLPQDAVVFVRMRVGSPDGLVLGESPQVSLPFGSYGWTTFAISPAIVLTPGTVYVIELVFVGANGNPAWAWCGWPGYPGGSRFTDGVQDPDDLAFREGVTVNTADDILSEFEIAVAGGQLAGVGPGDSADGKLNAMRNKLQAIAALIGAGDIASACDEIASALAKTDGDPKPPDMVAGPAAVELAANLRALSATLGCGP